MKIKALLEKETANTVNLEKQLEEISGVDQSTINNFKKKPAKEMKDICGLIKIIRHLWAEREFDLMIDYSEQVNPNFQTARYMLEYLDTNGLHQAKDNLIDRMIDTNNAESKAWAKLYKLDTQVARRLTSPFEAIHQFSNFGGKLENKIVAQIFSAYVYLDQKLYEQVLNVVEGTMESLKQVNDSFIENMYMTRLLLLKAEAHNRQNEVVKGRECSQTLLNMSISQTYRAWAYLQLGNSYILSDYDKSKQYLNEALELPNISEKVKTNIKRSHNFLHNIWNKECAYLDENSTVASDIHEVAFSLINKNEKSRAEEALSNVKTEDCTKNELAFHFYIKGLITESIKDFTESIKYFNQSGDIHFKLLPIMKLKQFNVDAAIIELLAE